MTTWAFWEQTIYSLLGFGFGVVVGRYLPQRRPPAKERQMASRRADGKRDIPRFLTIVILVMMVLSVGGVVENTISQNHLRNQRHADVEGQLAQTGAIAKNAQALAIRVKADEQFLSQLVVTISTAKTPKAVEKAIHKFIRQSRKEDNQPLPGVPTGSVANKPVQAPPKATHSPKPTATPISAPRPTNTHPPPHHPKPKPSPTPTPTPVVPVHIPIPGPVPVSKCLIIPFIGPIICQR